MPLAAGFDRCGPGRGTGGVMIGALCPDIRPAVAGPSGPPRALPSLPGRRRTPHGPRLADRLPATPQDWGWCAPGPPRRVEPRALRRHGVLRARPRRLLPRPDRRGARLRRVGRRLRRRLRLPRLLPRASRTPRPRPRPGHLAGRLRPRGRPDRRARRGARAAGQLPALRLHDGVPHGAVRGRGAGPGRPGDRSGGRRAGRRGRPRRVRRRLPPRAPAAVPLRLARHPGHRALARVVDGRPTGYGVVRPAQDEARIGPLFADTPADAAALLDGLAAEARASARTGSRSTCRRSIRRRCAWPWSAVWSRRSRRPGCTPDPSGRSPASASSASRRSNWAERRTDEGLTKGSGGPAPLPSPTPATP